MDDATAARPDLASAVYSISLEDLRFNLEKKNTSKSKRAVGTDELRRVIASLELQGSPSALQFTQISTYVDTSPSPLPHNPRSEEAENQPRRRDVSAEAQPGYSEKGGQVLETITIGESAWTEGFLVNETKGLFEEEEVKATEKVRGSEGKGPRVTTPELQSTEVVRSVSPLRIGRLEEDIDLSTPRQPVIEVKVLPPTSAERSPEPEHRPNVPFYLSSVREEGEVEPCPTAFPPRPKKPKRPKAVPTFETVQQTQIPPVPRPAEKPKPEKVDVGLEAVKIAPTLDIGGRAGLEIRQKEASIPPNSPATESKESEDVSVPSKRGTIGLAKARVSLQPLHSTTLSSFAPSLTTKATGSPRSADGAETLSKSQSPFTPSKRPQTAVFSLPPESPFDLPTRPQVRTSMETLESVSIAGKCIPQESEFLVHQTSLERLEGVTVPGKGRGELRVQRMGVEAVQPRRVETSEVGVATVVKTCTDQVTATEIATGLSSWTMSLYPSPKPIRTLALQSTLSDSIQPLLPPTPVRNRRRRKQAPGDLVYKQGTGENGALFQLSPTMGRMVKVKEYVVINEGNREKINFPPLYSPDVVHAMALQRRASHKGLSREKAALSPFRAGESYRSKEFFLRFRGPGSVGSRINSRDACESPEKAFRKTPKLNFKLL